MGKFIKNALVFMGGMTVGGYCVVNAALRSQAFTTMIKDAIAKKTIEVIYGDEPRTVKRTVSYYDIYSHDHKAPNYHLECFSDIVFQTRQDAENVLDAMKKVIEQYGVISLTDAYDIAGAVAPSYAFNKYGWQSLSDAKVVRSRKGYFIKVPKETEIK